MTEAELFKSKDAGMSGTNLKNRSKAPVFRGFRFSKRPSDIDLIKGVSGCIIDCVPVGLQV